MQISLNRGWAFTPCFSDAFLNGKSVPDEQIVELPHCTAETPFDYFDESIYQMNCGYRRTLHVPDEWSGKRVILWIGAAAHSAEVFLDGVSIAEHHCGYTAFSADITDVLTPGRASVLVVRVDSRENQNIPPFGDVIDYMTYGGLYREVWLDIRPQTYIQDVFPVADSSGSLTSRIAVFGETAGLTLRQRVLDGGSVIAEQAFPAAEREQEVSLRVPDVKAWDLDTPKLYTLETTLLSGSEVLDRTENRIGFRDVQFRADGFYLNGKKVKLRGLNRHQSYPYVGYAMPASIQRYDADILKNELGCNCVRTSHYPQSPHFIDRCDELGLLVFTEIPGWQHIGDAEWKAQALRNVEDMVRQYRGHPSIILWGVRINESHDDDELYRKTNAAAHALDPSRQTGGVRCIRKSHLLEDVYTYNDFLHDGKAGGCRKKKEATSDLSKPYLITEYNGHMFPTKSYDTEEHRLEHALRHARVLNAVAAQEDIAGSFGWCMFDYNTHRDFGSGDRICYHGVLDMFRNKKLAAEVYASQGCSGEVLAVSSAMDIGEHPAAFRGRILAFTNADSVRLYRNGRLIREFMPSDSEFAHLPHPPVEIDDFLGDEIQEQESFTPTQAKYVKELINYAARFGYSDLPLHLRFKMLWLMLRYRMSFQNAYDLYNKYTNNWGDAATDFRFDGIRDGRVVSSVTKAPVQSIHLHAQVSSDRLTESDQYDVSLVRISMRDQNENVLPFCQEAVALQTEGPIRLIGPDRAILRGGMGGTFVRSIGLSGDAALTLTAPGASPLKLHFTIDAYPECNG